MPDPAQARELAAVDDALAGRPVPPDLAEWEELTRLLVADRPTLDPAAAERIDARVAHAIRAPARPRRRLRLLPPALGLVAASLLVVVAVLSAGGQKQFGSAGDSAGGGSVASDRAGAQDEAGVEPSGGGSVAAPPPIAPPFDGSTRADGRRRRAVERSAALILAAPAREIDAVSARIQAETRRQGGFVAASTVASGGGSFTLRIPTRNLDAAVAALSRLAAVRERSQSSRDITARTVSTAERVQDARAERTALLRRLRAADTLDEARELRARLARVSRELADARAARRRVANRASFATVTVDLVTAPAAEEDGAGVWTPGDAVQDARRVLEVAASVALLGLAVLLPLALVAAPLVLAARWGTRRRRERALDAV